MEYAIITPTYEPHFQYIDKYLKSFDKFVLDKDKIKIYFVISSNEKENFEKIISKYRKKCLIEVLFYDEILKQNNVKQTPDEILKKYGHYTYQTLKKYYSLITVPERYSLMLDCESMWIRPVKMSEVFENYFKAPYFLMSDLDKRRNYIKEFVKNNPEFWLFKETSLCAYILNSKINNKYFFEDYDWFYDKKIFNDFINEIGTPIGLLQKIDKYNFKHLFEIVLYRMFVYLNNDKYNYKILEIDDYFEQYLSNENYSIYKESLMQRWRGSTGLAEQVLVLLTKNSKNEIIDLYTKFKLLKVSVYKYSEL